MIYHIKPRLTMTASILQLPLSLIAVILWTKEILTMQKSVCQKFDTHRQTKESAMRSFLTDHLKMKYNLRKDRKYFNSCNVKKLTI